MLCDPFIDLSSSVFRPATSALVAPAGKDKICTGVLWDKFASNSKCLLWGLHLDNSEFFKYSTGRKWFLPSEVCSPDFSLHQLMPWQKTCSSGTEKVKKPWHRQAFFISLFSSFFFLSPSTANKLVNVPPGWGAGKVVLCLFFFFFWFIVG